MPRPWPVVVALALAAAGCLEPPPAAQASAAPQDATAQPGEVLVPARKLAELYAVGEVRGFVINFINDENMLNQKIRAYTQIQIFE